jgi:hypothetical protein
MEQAFFRHIGKKTKNEVSTPSMPSTVDSMSSTKDADHE